MNLDLVCRLCLCFCWSLYDDNLDGKQTATDSIYWNEKRPFNSTDCDELKFSFEWMEKVAFKLSNLRYFINFHCSVSISSAYFLMEEYHVWNHFNV